MRIREPLRLLCCLNPPEGPDATALQQVIERLRQELTEKEENIRQIKAEKEQSIQQIKAESDTQLKQAKEYHEQRLIEKLKEKDEQLVGKLNDKDAIIRDKELVITEVTNQNNWLRGEYAKLNDRLNALLLPPPKRSIWDKILRRNVAKVD